MKSQKERAIASIKEYYGDLLLAIYERGSSLYELRTNMSDYDLQVIVKAKKETLLINKVYSSSLKMSDGEFDIQVIDEYIPTAAYLKEHIHEIIISRPVELLGGCYGYYRSYAKDLLPLTIAIGEEIPGKRFAMAHKSKKIAEALIHSPLSAPSIKAAIIPEGKYREELLEMKKMSVLSTQAEVEYYSQLKLELTSYLSVLEAAKLTAIETMKVEPIETHISKLIAMLLPPV